MNIPFHSRPLGSCSPGPPTCASCGSSSQRIVCGSISVLFNMDYETKVYPRSGGYGKFNRLVVLFSWFPTFAVMLNLFCDIFYTLIPELYHCKPDPRLLPSCFQFSNYSKQGYLNITIPWVNGSRRSHCQLFKYPRNVSVFNENLPKQKVSCTRGWEYTHSAGLNRNYVTEWDLVCGDYWKVPLQHLCFMAGWIFGYVLLGTLCDWVGRRRGFLISVSLSSVLGVALCIANNPVVFLLLRLAQGAMLAGVLLASYISRLEVCDPPNRLIVAMIGGFFGVGAELLLPVLVVLCRDWKILQAVATLPLILLLSYWCCESVFPESPRWLLSTSQLHQAKRSLRMFSSGNALCLRDENQPGERLLADMDSVYGDNCQPEFHTVLELRQTRVVWRNCLILSFTLFIGTGIQYCFKRNLPSFTTNFYFTYFLRVLTRALSCLFLCFTVNRFGRRSILLLSAIITGLSSLLLLALTLYLHDGLLMVLSVLGLLSSQALAMLSLLFASEVMPTVIRGGCLGLVFAAGCVGIAASSLMELQNNAGYFLHHVIFASFAVLSVLCIMLLPESRRKPLPDSLDDGESWRRPPLFLLRSERDSLLLLLPTNPPPPEYNASSYSCLLTATHRMLCKGEIPLKMAVPAQSSSPTPPPLEVGERVEEGSWDSSFVEGEDIQPLNPSLGLLDSLSMSEDI
ncbi:putative solute carrier family 22 member 31 [Gadus macrocephalus]|uniref:putative solute carrier family 22 member 31 n=1 Tax=Gadus macrocephalus TaxID=80720 RepID=UPI0028CB4084|nr:putative solute carrier family 22 member 31 [Gadus macrocephalus]